MKAKQRHAADLLAAGYNALQVAGMVECNRRTISRWLKDPDFKAAIEEEARRIRQRFLKRMDSLRAKACDVLDKILESALGADTPTSLHLQAVKMVLPAYTPADLAKVQSDRNWITSLSPLDESGMEFKPLSEEALAEAVAIYTADGFAPELVAHKMLIDGERMDAEEVKRLLATEDGRESLEFYQAENAAEKSINALQSV